MSNSSNPDQEGLKDAFEGIRADGENNDELFFDPATGELRTGRGADDPDRLPATQMAREGFFLRESDGAMDWLPIVEEAHNGAVPDAVREELTFDSDTGELQAAGSAEVVARLPATRMVREGFF